MTRISLDSFVNTARLSNDGDVRIARGSQDGLVNKGTLGNRLVSFIENIGRKIGILRPDPSRSERQQQALQDFTQALKARYGDSVARQALGRSGLDQPGGHLTGRSILVATEQARQLEKDMLDAMPPLGEELDQLMDEFRSSEDYARERFESPAFAQRLGARLEHLHQDSGVPLSELCSTMRDVLRERRDIDPFSWKLTDQALARHEKQARDSGN